MGPAAQQFLAEVSRILEEGTARQETSQEMTGKIAHAASVTNLPSLGSHPTTGERTLPALSQHVLRCMSPWQLCGAFLCGSRKIVLLLPHVHAIASVATRRKAMWVQPSMPVMLCKLCAVYLLMTCMARLCLCSVTCAHPVPAI